MTDLVPLSAAVADLKVQADRLTMTVPVTWVVEKPLTTNANKVQYALTTHNWGGAVIAKLKALGCSRYHGVITYGGSYTIPDSMVNDGAALGVTPSITLLDTSYSSGASTQSFAQQAAARWKGKCDCFTAGNEPQDGNPAEPNYCTPPQYLAHLKSMYAGIKLGNPNAQVLAPATTSNGFNWVQRFLALNPGQWLDGWSWHTYYGRPEESYVWNLGAVPKMVSDALGHTVPMHIEEVGWWGPETSDQTGSAAVAFTATTCAQFASRYPFLCVAIDNFRSLCVYAAKDEGAQHWGATNELWVEKPMASSLRDAFVHIHAATGFALYTRGQADITKNTWFTRLDTPSGQRLAIGRMAQSTNERIWVISPAVGNLELAFMGGTKSTIPLVPGPQQVSVPVGQRALVLSAPGIIFPEFS